MTFDTTNGVLFSADAFGSFIALDGKLFADEVDFDPGLDRRGPAVPDQHRGQVRPPTSSCCWARPPASWIRSNSSCPLHGPVWRKDLGYFIDKYDKWSRYEPEVKGVLIVYASMYGNTEAAAQALAAKLCRAGHHQRGGVRRVQYPCVPTRSPRASSTATSSLPPSPIT